MKNVSVAVTPPGVRIRMGIRHAPVSWRQSQLFGDAFGEMNTTVLMSLPAHETTSGPNVIFAESSGRISSIRSGSPGLPKNTPSLVLKLFPSMSAVLGAINST